MATLKERVLEELNKIQGYYDYDPNIEVQEDTITWEDYEGDTSMVRITENHITLLDWDDPNFSKQITFDEFMAIIHGDDIPNQKERTGKEIMSEMAHTVTYLSNIGYDTTDLTVEEVLTIKYIILKAISKEAFMKPTLPIKDAFQ